MVSQEGHAAPLPYYLNAWKDTVECCFCRVYFICSNQCS